MSASPQLHSLPEELIKMILGNFVPPRVNVRFVRVTEPSTNAWQIGIRPMFPYPEELKKYLDIAKQSKKLWRCAMEVLGQKTCFLFHLGGERQIRIVTANPMFDDGFEAALRECHLIRFTNTLGLAIIRDGIVVDEALREMAFSVRKVDVNWSNDVGWRVSLATLAASPLSPYSPYSPFAPILRNYLDILEFRCWDFEGTAKESSTPLTAARVYRLVDLPTAELGKAVRGNDTFKMLSRSDVFDLEQKVEAQRKAAEVKARREDNYAKFVLAMQIFVSCQLFLTLWTLLMHFIVHVFQPWYFGCEVKQVMGEVRCV